MKISKQAKTALYIGGGLLLTAASVGVATMIVRNVKAQKEPEEQTPEDKMIDQEKEQPGAQPFIGKDAYAGGQETNIRKTPEVNNEDWGLPLSDRWFGNVVTLGQYDTSNKIATVKSGKRIGRIVGIETDKSDKVYRWFRVKNEKGIGDSDKKYGYVREDVVEIINP